MAELANVSGLFTDANLKLYYKFSETGGTTVTDSSAGGNNGTASNASILNNIGGPFGNKGVFVAASSNKVTITDAASLKPTGNFSVTGWFRTATTGTAKCLFQSFSVNPTNHAGIFIFLDTDDKLHFESGKNTGNVLDTDYKRVASAVTVADGKWHHFAAVWEGSNLNLYLDGVLSGTTAWANAPAYAATNYVRVGCDNFSGTDGDFHNGDIDDMALFNGTALSQVQVNALFIRGQAPALANTGIFSDTNLKLYYKLDDAGGTTVTDSSAGGNTGTASAASINANDSYGMVGSRGIFDSASSNKITVTDATSLKPTGNFSVGCWIRTTTVAASTIFQSYSQNTNVAGFQIGMNNNPQLLSGKNTGTTQGTDWQKAASSTVISDGKWHHLVGVYDGSNLNLYIDGKLDTQVAWANAPAYAGTNYVRVACNNVSGSDINFFNGDLDEVFLLNGTALNSQQINQLYNGLQGNVLSSVTDIATDANLKLYYKLDETGGTTVTDSSAAGHNGTASAASILNNAYGKFNNKGVFVGATPNYITVTSSADFNPGTGSISVGGWFKTSFNASATNGFMAIMDKYDTGGWALLMKMNNTADDGKMEFFLKDSGGAAVATTLSAATFNDNRWHHAVGIRSGDNGYCYVDGVLVGSVSGVTAYNVTDVVDLGVGIHKADGTSYPWDGDMDDLFLLKGTALTAGQVMELYRLGGVAGTPINIDVTSSFLPGVKII